MKFKKRLEKNDSTEDGLATFQRSIENAAGKVAHHTKAQREKEMIGTPEKVRHVKKLQKGAQ